MHDVVAAPVLQSAESSIPSVGSLIDDVYDLNQRKKEITQQLEDVKQQIALVEQEIMGQLDKQELSQCRGRKGKVSITTSLVPTVHDWEAFQAYILDNGALHLLERRAATTAWRELHESGEEVPGVSPFNKRGLSVRKA